MAKVTKEQFDKFQIFNSIFVESFRNHMKSQSALLEEEFKSFGGEILEEQVLEEQRNTKAILAKIAKLANAKEELEKGQKKWKKYQNILSDSAGIRYLANNWLNALKHLSKSSMDAAQYYLENKIGGNLLRGSELSDIQSLTGVKVPVQGYPTDPGKKKLALIKKNKKLMKLVSYLDRIYAAYLKKNKEYKEKYHKVQIYREKLSNKHSVRIDRYLKQGGKKLIKIGSQISNLKGDLPPGAEIAFKRNTKSEIIKANLVTVDPKADPLTHSIRKKLGKGGKTGEYLQFINDPDTYIKGVGGEKFPSDYSAVLKGMVDAAGADGIKITEILTGALLARKGGTDFPGIQVKGKPVSKYEMFAAKQYLLSSVNKEYIRKRFIEEIRTKYRSGKETPEDLFTIQWNKLKLNLGIVYQYLKTASDAKKEIGEVLTRGVPSRAKAPFVWMTTEMVYDVVNQLFSLDHKKGRSAFFIRFSIFWEKLLNSKDKRAKSVAEYYKRHLAGKFAWLAQSSERKTVNQFYATHVKKHNPFEKGQPVTAVAAKGVTRGTRKRRSRRTLRRGRRKRGSYANKRKSKKIKVNKAKRIIGKSFDKLKKIVKASDTTRVLPIKITGIGTLKGGKFRTGFGDKGAFLKESLVLEEGTKSTAFFRGRITYGIYYGEPTGRGKKMDNVRNLLVYDLGNSNSQSEKPSSTLEVQLKRTNKRFMAVSGNFHTQLVNYKNAYSEFKKVIDKSQLPGSKAGPLKRYFDSQQYTNFVSLAKKIGMNIKVVDKDRNGIEVKFKLIKGSLYKQFINIIGQKKEIIKNLDNGGLKEIIWRGNLASKKIGWVTSWGKAKSPSDMEKHWKDKHQDHWVELSDVYKPMLVVYKRIYSFYANVIAFKENYDREFGHKI